MFSKFRVSKKLSALSLFYRTELSKKQNKIHPYCVNSKYDVRHDSEQGEFKKSESHNGNVFKSISNISTFFALIFSRISLRYTLLFTFTLFLIVPIFLFAVWVEGNIKNKYEEVILNNQSQIANTISFSLTTYVKSQIEKFTLVASLFSGRDLPSSIDELNSSNWLGSLRFSNKKELLSSSSVKLSGFYRHPLKFDVTSVRSHMIEAFNNPGKVFLTDKTFNLSNNDILFMFYVDSHDNSIMHVGQLLLDDVSRAMYDVNTKNPYQPLLLSNNGKIIIDNNKGVESTKIDKIRQFYTGANVRSLNENDLMFEKRNIKFDDSNQWLLVFPYSVTLSTNGLVGTPQTDWLIPKVALLFGVIFSCLMTIFIMNPFDFLNDVLSTYSLNLKDGLLKIHHMDCSTLKYKLYFSELVYLKKVLKNMARDLSDYHQGIQDKVLEQSAKLERESAERRRIDEQLRYNYTHDQLTGLPNGNLFSDRFCSAMLWSTATQSDFAVIKINVSGIDSIQRQYSHIVGDSMLKNMASKLRQVMRQEDTLARSDAYEFKLLVVDVNSSSQVQKIVNKLNRLVNDPNSYANQGFSGTPKIPIKASVSVEILNHKDYRGSQCMHPKLRATDDIGEVENVCAFG